MFSYRDKRLHLRYARPRSEEPFRLIGDNFVTLIPEAGFRWVSGVWGENGYPDRFLIQAKARDQAKLSEPLRDCFTTLINLTPSEDAFLDIANRFGSLRVLRVHFHSDETDCQWGEPLSFWYYEVGLLQRWFEVWKLFTSVEDPVLLRKKLCQRDLISVPPSANVRSSVLKSLVSVINTRLWAAITGETSPTCLECGCECRAVLKTPHVSYFFRVSQERECQTVKDKVVPVVQPNGFLAAAWLGFGELVAGQRIIRTCEVCGQWMDITDTAKPNAKRMHTRCSNTQRQRRWRQAKRASSSEGQP
jgi:hypothetical protein